MAVRIRLTRVGATKRPAYRVVAIDKRRARDGRAIEILGFYDPLTDPATVRLDTERIQAWIGKGAQPSDTVVKLMRQAGMGGVAPAPVSAPTPPKRAPRKAKAEPKTAAAATAQPATAATPAEAAEDATAASAPSDEAAEAATVASAPGGEAEAATPEERAAEPPADAESEKT